MKREDDKRLTQGLESMYSRPFSFVNKNPRTGREYLFTFRLKLTLATRGDRSRTALACAQESGNNQRNTFGNKSDSDSDSGVDQLVVRSFDLFRISSRGQVPERSDDDEQDGENDQKRKHPVYRVTNVGDQTPKRGDDRSRQRVWSNVTCRR